MACSFAPGYSVARPSSSWIEPTGHDPAAPNVTILSLKRGYDDGNGGSCSDAGVLAISVEANKEAAGYEFIVADGEFPDAVLPEGYILPVETENGLAFFFYWLDSARANQALPLIDVQISVTQISRNGKVSDPTILQVHDSGVGS